jgi:hypothetical protein
MKRTFHFKEGENWDVGNDAFCEFLNNITFLGRDGFLYLTENVRVTIETEPKKKISPIRKIHNPVTGTDYLVKKVKTKRGMRGTLIVPKKARRKTTQA